MMNESSKLRAALEKIAKNHPAFQEQALKSVAIANTVTINRNYSPFVGRGICYDFAFDLFNCKEYQELVLRSKGVKRVTSKVVKYLVDQQALVEIDENQILGGCIALYFEGNNYTHAGKRLANGRIISKWGTGHVFEHAPLEVPESYGHNISYFAISDEAYFKKALLEFLQRKP